MSGFDVQALFVALGLSGAAFVIGRVVVYMGEKSLEKRHGVIGARDRLAACAKLEAALERRRTEKAKELKEADARASEMARRRKQLERRIADAVSAGEALIRVIGEEVKDTPCFHAEVINRYVGQAGFEQKQHAYIDSSWAAPQVLEIWARSVAEARSEIERRYPPAFGYHISRLLDSDQVEAMKPARKN
jgi:hypothetical protein